MLSTHLLGQKHFGVTHSSSTTACIHSSKEQVALAMMLPRIYAQVPTMYFAPKQLKQPNNHKLSGTLERTLLLLLLLHTTWTAVYGYEGVLYRVFRRVVNRVIVTVTVTVMLTTKRGSSAASGSPAARHRASSRNDACRSSGVLPPSSGGFSAGLSDEASCTTCSSTWRHTGLLNHCVTEARRHSRRAGAGF